MSRSSCCSVGYASRLYATGKVAYRATGPRSLLAFASGWTVPGSVTRAWLSTGWVRRAPSCALVELCTGSARGVLLTSAEGKAHGGTQRILIARWSQKSRSRVARKDDDIRGVLISHQQPLIAGIEGEMARGLAATVHMLNRFERSLAIVDGENRDVISAAVRGIDEPALGIDRDGGRGI